MLAAYSLTVRKSGYTDATGGRLGKMLRQLPVWVEEERSICRRFRKRNSHNLKKHVYWNVDAGNHYGYRPVHCARLTKSTTRGVLCTCSGPLLAHCPRRFQPPVTEAI